MSLINEALKKAQSERPGPSRPEVPMHPGNVPPTPKPPRKKRYLFGFVVSILVVGLLSALLSTYLVLQLIGPDGESAQPVPEKVIEQAQPVPDTPPEATDVGAVATQEETENQIADPIEPAGNPEPDSPEAPVAETAQSATETTSESQQPIAEELVIDVPDAVASEPTAESEAAPVADASQPEQGESQSVTPADPTPPEPVQVKQYATSESNPQVWLRLEDFEIRGIMSGGAKVLIYDNRSQRARTYTPGDLIDGALSLRVAAISSSEIQFTNNEGSIFTKVF